MKEYTAPQTAVNINVYRDMRYVRLPLGYTRRYWNNKANLMKAVELQ